MPVRIGLVLIFAVGLIWELSTPGVSAPGGAAAVALLILLGAPALTGLAQWWDILFVLVGILLIVLELFVIPGFGIAGISGVVLLGMGFIGTFIAPDPGGGLLPSSPEAQQQALRGVLTMLVAFFGGAIGLYFISRHFQSLPIFNKLVLATTSGNDSQPASMFEPMRPMGAGRPRAGDTGIVETQLRPSGKVRFGDRLYDVVSGHGIIDAGATVVVRTSDPFSIVVEKASHDDVDVSDANHTS
jgi:membrane-bound serine protease (ClpP class)